MLAGKFSEALAQSEKASEIDRDEAHTNLGITLLAMGRIDEGVKELEAAAKFGGSSFFKGNLAFAYALSGRKDEALKLAEEIKADKNEARASYHLAYIYAGLGEKEQALNFLEKAYEEHAIIAYPLFTVEPFFASLRQDPRFKELAKKMGLDKSQPDIRL